MSAWQRVWFRMLVAVFGSIRSSSNRITTIDAIFGGGPPTTVVSVVIVVIVIPQLCRWIGTPKRCLVWNIPHLLVDNKSWSRNNRCCGCCKLFVFEIRSIQPHDGQFVPKSRTHGCIATRRVNAIHLLGSLWYECRIQVGHAQTIGTPQYLNVASIDLAGPGSSLRIHNPSFATISLLALLLVLFLNPFDITLTIITITNQMHRCRILDLKTNLTTSAFGLYGKKSFFCFLLVVVQNVLVVAVHSSCCYNYGCSGDGGYCYMQCTTTCQLAGWKLLLIINC